MRNWQACQESRNKIWKENMSQALYIRSQEARLLELRATLADLRRPKSVREEVLREIRRIEQELGVNETSNYNGKSIS